MSNIKTPEGSKWTKFLSFISERLYIRSGKGTLESEDHMDPEGTEFGGSIDPNLLVCKVSCMDDDGPRLRSLFQLVREGDLYGLKSAVSSFPLNQVLKRINALDENKTSCLHYATRYAHLPILEYLIGLGADVNIQGDDELTPLHFAARFKKMSGLMSTHSSRRSSSYRGSNFILNKMNQKKPSDKEEVHSLLNSVLDEMDKLPVPPSVISFLIMNGANINQRDKYGLSPLHYAAMRGNYLATKELLQCQDIKIEIRDQQNLTPLHLACAYGHKDVTSLLLSFGAKVQNYGEHNQNALHKACSVGNTEIIKLLTEYVSKNYGEDELQMILLEEDSDGNTPLLLAVESGSTQTVEHLIKKSSDVNSCNASKSTPLHIACKIGNFEVVKLLIQERARIDSLNGQYQTPLMVSCRFNHVEIVEYLLTCGAQIDRRDRQNRTPLLLASMEGNSEAVLILLKRGADIFALDRTDKSTVYLAAANNNPIILKTLLKEYCSLGLMDLGDHFDNSPFHIGALKGYEEVVEILLENGANIHKKNDDEQTPLHLAAKMGRTKIVTDILKRDRTAVNDSDFESHTALHLACIHGNSKVVSTLIDGGADIEARNYCLWTPLDCAGAYGQTKCANLLLDANAPIDPIDKNKTTPLHLSSRYGHEKVSSLLIQRGASLNQTNSSGHNALTLAIMNGKRDVVRAIIESENWMSAFESDFISASTGVRDTPLRLLVKQFPDLAKLVFDRCISTNLQSRFPMEKSKQDRNNLSAVSAEDPAFAITFNYELLDDTYIHKHDSFCELDANYKESSCKVWDENGSLMPSAIPYCYSNSVIKMNHPLMIMAEEKRVDLLGHPLCMALVRMKWNKFGRYVYYLNLSFYLLFVLSLTVFILVTPAPYSAVQILKFYKNETNNAGGSRSQLSLSNLSKILEAKLFTLDGVVQAVPSDACAVISQNKEEFVIERSYWSLIGKYVINLLGSIHLTKDVFLLTQNTLTRPRRTWIGALCVTLAWLNLLSNVRKVPLLGIYVVMFTDVLKTFLKFSIICGLFVIAFSLGFQALLGEQENFGDFSRSLMKTIVMMIGEFEYDDIFYDNVRNGIAEGKYSSLPYTFLTQSFFLIFLIIMPIIIMNLLVGLAVDDIKAVQDNAVLQRLAMQVTLNLDVEKLLPDILRRGFFLREEVLYPNNVNQAWGDPTLSRIVKATIAGRQTSDLENINLKQETLIKKFKSMKDQFQKVTTELTKIRESLSKDSENDLTEITLGDSLKK